MRFNEITDNPHAEPIDPELLAAYGESNKRPREIAVPLFATNGSSGFIPTGENRIVRETWSGDFHAFNDPKEEAITITRPLYRAWDEQRSGVISFKKDDETVTFRATPVGYLLGTGAGPIVYRDAVSGNLFALQYEGPAQDARQAGESTKGKYYLYIGANA